LFLSRNRLTDLPPGVFAGLPALTKLEWSRNRLTDLPEGVFAGLSALTKLDVSRNRLSDLPGDVFNDLSVLRGLDLHGNRLARLPQNVFADLPTLTWLNLSGNRLSGLPPGVFAGLSALTWLPLSDNRFTARLPPGVFTGVPGAALAAQGIPGRPRNVAVRARAAGLSVTWKAPARKGKGGIRAYHLRWKLKAAAVFAPSDSAEITAPARKHRITGLAAGGEYEVQIAAGNAFAYGKYARARGI